MAYFYKNWRPRRSVLFMPASNERAIQKAPNLDCDGVIFDLEDSIADGAREQAYENLKGIVAQLDLGAREKIIRINHPDASPFEKDVMAALECTPDCLLLPKIESAEEILKLSGRLEPETEIWAMIETPKGLLNLQEICATSEKSNLTCLVVGPNDLAKTTGAKMEPGRAVMLPWLMQVLAVARCYDLCVLDGVYNNFSDPDGLDTECRQGASMGYDGKTLIHPNQIEHANRHFGITETDFQRARLIINAFNRPENKDKAAIQLNGEMVERLHLESAKQVASAYEGARS